MSSPQIVLSLWENITLVGAFLRAVHTGFWALLLGPVRGNTGALSLKNHVILSMVRTFLSVTSVRHMQYMQPPLATLYEDCAKKRGFPQHSITLADGTKGYWIGSSNAEKVILWCHGGGYNLPASPGHLDFCADINDATGPDVAVLFLGYTLAPYAHFPRQLTQGVELLRHLINDLDHKPENIIIGGDSAGANLVLGIFSHLSHPHPAIAALELSAPLRGAVLFAPWTSFDNETWKSIRYNKYKDAVSPGCADLWSSNFLGGKPRDQYNEPMVAEAEWWRGLQAEEVLVVGGGDEILLDSIRTFAGKLQSVHPKTELVIIPHEFHDPPTLKDLVTGVEGQTGVIIAWIAERMGV